MAPIGATRSRSSCDRAYVRRNFRNREIESGAYVRRISGSCGDRDRHGRHGRPALATYQSGHPRVGRRNRLSAIGALNRHTHLRVADTRMPPDWELPCGGANLRSAPKAPGAERINRR